MIQYLLYRLRFHLRQWFPGKFPIHVDIELAGKCQLACVMCPFGDNSDGTGSFDSSKQGMMPHEMVSLAIRQAYKGGAKSIKFNFRGEPGLSPNLHIWVDLARALGFIDIMINTNLTAFSHRRLKGLADAGLDLLIVSVDGATKKTYESIRIKGDFGKLVGNLEYLNSLPNRPKIRINMTVQDKNRREVDMMEKVFGKLCDEIQFNAVRSDNSGERKKCPQPSQRLVIMWDGQVGACCSNWNNEAVIGKFPEQSLQEIWDGPKRKQLLYYAADPNRGGPCKGCLVGGSYK